MAAARVALVERITKETSVQVSLSLDGGELDLLPNDSKFPKAFPAQTSQHHATQNSASQQIWIWTGIGFLDHMIHALAKHGGWSLRVRTNGDLASKHALIWSNQPKADLNHQLMTTTPLRTPSWPLARPTKRRSVTAKASPALEMPMHLSMKASLVLSSSCCVLDHRN
jgi:hypothetical protein